MNSKDGIFDIARNLGVVANFVQAKIVGTATDCRVTAQTKTQPFVICYAKMYEQIIGINSSIGLYLQSLQDVLKSPSFDRDAATLRVQNGVSGGDPHVELWTGQSQHKIKLLGPQFVESFLQYPTFKRPSFELRVTPTQEGIELLKYWAKQEAMNTGDDVYFWPFIDQRGRLHLQIDQGPMDVNMMRFVFLRGTPLVNLAPYKYLAQPVVSILSLAATSKTLTMSFSNSGCITIDVDSGFGKYEFVLPGKDDLIWRKGLGDVWPQVWEVEKSMRDDEAMLPCFDPIASD